MRCWSKGSGKNRCSNGIGDSEWIHIGTLVTGRLPDRVRIDEQRILWTARYRYAFKPSMSELQADRDTTALFHFNNSLDGGGMTVDGRPYLIQGIAGSAFYD